MTDVIIDINDVLSRITYNDNIIRQWLLTLYEEKKDLQNEIVEVKDQLSKERTRLKNSDTNQQMINHACNIANLNEYMHRLKQIEINAKSIGLPMDEFYELGQSVL